jgi:hypothetical protein
LNERLTWTAHTNDIVKRVNFRLKHLSTCRCVLNEELKKGLVDALVQPIFDYVMWCISTRVVVTKKGFRGHTITVSDLSLATDVESIFLVSGRDWIM